MAKVEYSWGDGSSSIAKILHVLGIYDFSGVKNLIPDYAILNSVHLKATWYTNLSGKAEMTMKLDSNDAVIGGTFEISNGKTSTTSTSKDIKGYFNSGKSNVGECTEQLNLAFSASNGIARYWKVPKVWVEIDYTTVHTVTWKNHDGTVLETDSKVPYGTIPTYNGATPTKAETEQYIYTFKGWDKTVVAVTGDVTYTATFSSIRKYTITTYASNGGTVQGGGTYENGKTVTLIATPDAGYRFVSWSDGNTSATRTITVTANATYTATFELITHTVSIVASPPEGGGSGSIQVNHGVEIPIEATPNEGYRFVRWSDGDTNASRNIVVTEDATYTAVFEPIKYNITVTASPAEGGQSASIQAQHGTEIILQAIANEGYEFVKWSDGNTDAIRTVIATSDVNYTAEFALIMFAVATDTLCDDGTTGGTVTGGGTYASGASVTLTAIPNEGYEFVQWDDGSTDPTKVFTATADLNFMAEFRVLKFTITTQVTPEGAGGVMGGGTYNWGTMVYLTVAVKQGYRFVQWSDGVKSASRTVRVTEDVTYTAIFEPDEIKHIYIGTSQVKSVYYSAETNTITFVIDEVSNGTDVVGTVDGYHFAISNTAPTDAIEVAGVYVGTKQVHSS